LPRNFDFDWTGLLTEPVLELTILKSLRDGADSFKIDCNFMLNELTVNFVSNKRTQTELYLFWSSGVAILRDKKTFRLENSKLFFWC